MESTVLVSIILSIISLLIAAAAITISLINPNNSVGPTGPPGPRGRIGEIGPTGPTGPTGYILEDQIRFLNKDTEDIIMIDTDNKYINLYGNGTRRVGIVKDFPHVKSFTVDTNNIDKEKIKLFVNKEEKLLDKGKIYNFRITQDGNYTEKEEILKNTFQDQQPIPRTGFTPSCKYRTSFKGF